MTANELKMLLNDYLAILRSPGGSEKIGFAIKAHVAVLDLLEARCGNTVTIRDLPIYKESTERGEYREAEGCSGCSCSTPVGNSN